jgi:hypothetical protein
MRSIETLLTDARDDRLRRLPNYAQDLIAELAARLDQETRYARAVKERAAKEVDELRAQLTKGPEDADTFMDLPYSRVGDVEGQRPLGKGVNIEFRAPGLTEGEGFEVKLTEEGHLKIGGITRLAVVPEYPNQITVKAD